MRVRSVERSSALGFAAHERPIRQKPGKKAQKGAVAQAVANVLQIVAFGSGTHALTRLTTAGPVELNRQALASLGATCTDHRTPAAGLHADQKAVGPFTFRDRRLKSAFHHRSRQNKALDYIKKRLDLSTRLAASQQVIANTREFSVLDPGFASAGSATAQTRDASDRWAQFQPAKG